ncbi:DUF120 domain-containing protein [Candidatus Pyrohabitans sp.]
MELAALIALAKAGAYQGYAFISSAQLASELGTSQQTASRRLKLLESRGYIAREVSPRGQRVKLTARGKRTLGELYAELRTILGDSGKAALTLCGEVSSGLGEGSYYMSLKGYVRQFEDKLGFTPFPGTLNLTLKTREDIRSRQELVNMGGIAVKGFVHGGRRLGDVTCFHAELRGERAAVVLPARTHHSLATLEVIAPVNLRQRLGLRDGDVVAVKVYV